MTTNGRNSGGTPGDAERDPRLDRLYRETAREEPPARLDAVILAAARREVGARPHAVSARLRAWRVPVAFAAVVVLSVSLVTLVQEQGGEQLAQPPAGDRLTQRAETAPVPAPVPQAVQPEAAKAPAGAAPAAPAPAARDDAALGATASSRVDEYAPRRAVEAPAPRPVAPEPQASPRVAATPSPHRFPSVPPAPEQQRPPVSASPAAGAGAATQSTGIRGAGVEDTSAAPATPALAAKPVARARDAAATSEAAGTVSATRPPAAVPAEKPRARAEARLQKSEHPPADAATVAALLKEFEPQPPEKWLERIEALKREGRQAESDEMLAEFKRRFPAHPLPPGLR